VSIRALRGRKNLLAKEKTAPEATNKFSPEGPHADDRLLMDGLRESAGLNHHICRRGEMTSPGHAEDPRAVTRPRNASWSKIQWIASKNGAGFC